MYSLLEISVLHEKLMKYQALKLFFSVALKALLVSANLDTFSKSKSNFNKFIFTSYKLQKCATGRYHFNHLLINILAMF